MKVVMLVAWWNRALRYHVKNDAVRYDMCRVVGPTASPRTGASVLWVSTMGPTGVPSHPGKIM